MPRLFGQTTWSHAKHLLWWRILCANLTGLRDAQRAGRTLSLDVSVRMFLEEISICVAELKRGWSSPGWLGVIQSVEDLNRTNRPRKGGCTPSAWAKSPIFSCPRTLAFLVLWPGLPPSAPPDAQAFGLELNYRTGFPQSQVCRGQTVGLLSLCNHRSQSLQQISSLSLSLSLYPNGSLSLGNPE